MPRRFKENRKVVLTIYLLLRISVVTIMIMQLFNHNYNDVFLCGLTLVLFLIPDFINKRFNIVLPNTLEISVILFIYAAEIMGEIRGFYINFKHWDTMLHTTNGFLMAAIGVSMIDILNRSERFKINLSPVFVAVTAFCFSMTVGVLWEFCEFSLDALTGTDMQKDYLCSSISTVSLNQDNANVPIVIENIEKTVVTGYINGERTETVIDGGYLDIGISDTMKDLMVNFIGAAVFSVIGGFYVRSRGRSKFAEQFIPKLKE